MRRCLWILFMLWGCGDDAPATIDAPGMGSADAPTCLPQSAVGAFYRRQPNPRMIAGGHTFSDTNLDTQIDDPDLVWDGTVWHLYYGSPHGTFASPGASVIRHATSSDLATWTFQDAPVLAMGTEPTVAINASAAADHRFVMLYKQGATLGAAFSSDGATFTPATATLDLESGATMSDPEIAVVSGKFHLWFSSSSSQKYGIGHATSSDGLAWTVESSPVPSLLRASADPKSGGGQPSVIYDEMHCKWEMWLSNDLATDSDNQPTNFFNTKGMWNASSINGTSWTINYSSIRDVVWDGTANGEHVGIRQGADVAIRGTGRYMVYTGYDDQNVPSGSTLPARAGGTAAGVMVLNVATRDAP